MTINKNILFICHESSRTGAPISLLYFIRWIKNNTNQEFVILIDKGGELDKDFRNLGPTYILRPCRQSMISKIWTKISYRSFINNRLKSYIKIPFGMIYNNTMANGILIASLKTKTHAYIFTHVHELESVIQSTGKKNIHLIKKNTNHYIAASLAVKNNLIQNHQIPDNNITIHHECIESIPDTSGEIELMLPIALNGSNFIIGGAGFVDYRKGFDLFLKTARKLIRENNYTDFKFIWVGEFGRNIEYIVEDYIRKHNLTDHVFFMGGKKSPYPYYQMLDVFYLTSREDPFPLVMLENAYLGKPVIGFKGTGGVDEFLYDYPELLIEDFNIGKAVEKIIQLSENKNLCKKLGGKLSEKVKENFMIEKKGKKYFKKIEK